jgi:hypothetical protein
VRIGYGVSTTSTTKAVKYKDLSDKFMTSGSNIIVIAIILGCTRWGLPYGREPSHPYTLRPIGPADLKSDDTFRTVRSCLLWYTTAPPRERAHA